MLIRQVAEYIIGGGGKRLRPALLILSARACGYEGRHHHELAAVDRVHPHRDAAPRRRRRRIGTAARPGRPRTRSSATPPRVLVGDFVYSRAFQMMVAVESMRVLRVLADATNVIAEGEVLQLMNCHNPDLDEEGYLQVIRYKTAKLFEAATRLGAILGEPGAGSRGSRWRPTARISAPRFQLIDDVLDYSGDHAVIGKNVGDDLAEGKTTLPLIYAMKHGTREQAQLVRRAIECGRARGARRGARGDPRLRRARLRARAGAGRSAHRVRGARGPAAFKLPGLFATIGRFRGDANVLDCRGHA